MTPLSVCYLILTTQLPTPLLLLPDKRHLNNSLCMYCSTCRRKQGCGFSDIIAATRWGDLTLHACHASMTELIQGEEIHLRCFRVSMVIARWPCMSVYMLLEICISGVCILMSHIVTVLMHTAHGRGTGSVCVRTLCRVSSKKGGMCSQSDPPLAQHCVWCSGIVQWDL